MAENNGKTVNYVAYYRVSTDKQGRSGLGLEAQLATVESHARAMAATSLPAFRKWKAASAATGPNCSKPWPCAARKKPFSLLPNLDRLSRNVAFIANLMESRVEFVACDMPEANKLTLHIMAAMAQHEREATSQRTKEALQAAKVRGQKLGNPRPDIPAINRAWKEETRQFRALHYPAIKQMRERGLTLSEIAQNLNERGIKTCNNRTWYASTVKQLLDSTERDAPKIYHKRHELLNVNR